jgi:hypothetical protein
MALDSMGFLGDKYLGSTVGARHGVVLGSDFFYRNSAFHYSTESAKSLDTKYNIDESLLVVSSPFFSQQSQQGES